MPFLKVLNLFKSYHQALIIKLQREDLLELHNIHIYTQLRCTVYIMQCQLYITINKEGGMCNVRRRVNNNRL